MVGDALGVNVTYDEPEDFDGEELLNEEAQRFYQLLNEMNMLLFKGPLDSKLSMCVRLLAAKSNWNVPNQCLEFFAKIMLDATPMKDNMLFTQQSLTFLQRFTCRTGYKVLDQCVLSIWWFCW
ncbi:hypothetical protein KIW84_057080 [Lathyrus oleraceus]|uniref:Uncharacterized protein n=1 Tax=Pisum sativum TaxID=3888 RepID=A0A9D4X280_PEA|nr:hypothetical protein KIW84_057080 [Pisum sativum]